MIEWTTTKHASVEILPNGEEVHGYDIPVGEDGPEILGLAITGDGGGVIVEGTLSELYDLVSGIRNDLSALAMSRTIPNN